MEYTSKKAELYPVYCTECGELISNRFFPLDNLLMQYHVGKSSSIKEKKAFVDMMGIGAVYGRTILPEAEPLIRDGKFVFPDFRKISGQAVRITCFQCNNNDIPRDKLVPVFLNIAAIVAQFYLMSGFEKIYKMLDIQWKKNKAEEDLEELSEDQQQLMELYCDEFANLPYVHMPPMTTDASQRREEIERILNWILESAIAEESLAEAEVGKRNFALEDLYAGWRYEEINGREMPLALTVIGSTGAARHSAVCCCDHCFKPIPYRLGAYRQRIIGLLGTQETGKSTYLAALTDAIDRGEVTTMTVNGKQRSTQVTIEACMADDMQWTRVKRAGGEKPGLLWLYQNGFPPDKTAVSQLDAPALTFLVSRRDGSIEPVMYTLADISGEAFQNTVSKANDPAFVAAQHRLLYSCSALIVVVSSRQIHHEDKYSVRQEQADGQKRKDNYIHSPQEILTCYQEFLPQDALPTAVVMTAADEVNGGDLREPLRLAYDIKKASPMIWSEERETLLLNGEVMRNSIRAVKDYLNKNFGDFMGALHDIMLKDHDAEDVRLAAFAVSNGTQCAPYYYLDATEPSYHLPDACQKRYEQMRAARFGISAPLLWLWACDGLLEVGRGDKALSCYPPQVREKIATDLNKSLFH